ncbi:MAG: efflux RND transporter periplasmic adaptor subunit [Mariniphaga sp.]
MAKRISKVVLESIFLIFFFLHFSCNRQSEQKMNDSLTPANKLILSEAQVQLANIKVTEVVEGTIGQNKIYTGTLKVNELSAANISSRATGRIQKLFFKNTGESVNKGDSLYQFYSEELVAAEREYFRLHSSNWNFSGKYEPSLILEDKLLFLGMLPLQIEKLKADGKILFSVTILSPVKGTIRSINITEGQYVNAGLTLFELADYNNLWAEARVYQDDLQFLEVGMPLTVTIQSAGNMPVWTTISSINPSFEQGKNVTLIRTLIDNPDKNFYPGMLALFQVQSKTNRGIVVPNSAVIMDKNGSLAWIRNEDGSFSGRIITTGIQSVDSVLILSGIRNKELVVTSGAYLLNSELIFKKGMVNNGMTETINN